MDSSKDIADAHPYLQERWPKILAAYETIHPDKTLTITCTYRSPEVQKKLYRQGRTDPGDIVTQIDGETKKSQHNYFPARAIDICVNGAPASAVKVAPIWDEHFYYPLLGICKELGLVSGGAWIHFKDWCHIELPSDIT
jgi:peptidoglycan LD-endopeptidase CwlK